VEKPDLRVKTEGWRGMDGS